MIARRKTLMLVTLACLMSLACSDSTAEAPGEAPPTPTMPDYWSVDSDFEFAAEDVQGIAKALGASVSALRNTTYNVLGMRIKLNTIVASTPGDADDIMKALATMKPAEFFLRRGVLIYEFVGHNEAIPEMRKGRALIAEQ